MIIITTEGNIYDDGATSDGRLTAIGDFAEREQDDGCTWLRVYYDTHTFDADNIDDLVRILGRRWHEHDVEVMTDGDLVDSIVERSSDAIRAAVERCRDAFRFAGEHKDICAPTPIFGGMDMHCGFTSWCIGDSPEDKDGEKLLKEAFRALTYVDYDTGNRAAYFPEPGGGIKVPDGFWMAKGIYEDLAMEVGDIVAIGLDDIRAVRRSGRELPGYAQDGDPFGQPEALERFARAAGAQRPPQGEGSGIGESQPRQAI